MDEPKQTLLSRSLRAQNPLLTRTTAIADTVRVARGGRRLTALVLNVGALSRRRTFALAVAHLTQRTVQIRIRRFRIKVCAEAQTVATATVAAIHCRYRELTLFCTVASTAADPRAIALFRRIGALGNLGTGTLVAVDVTRLTKTLARAAAARIVNAHLADAVGVLIAEQPVFQLRYARALARAIRVTFCVFATAGRTNRRRLLFVTRAELGGVTTACLGNCFLCM